MFLRYRSFLAMCMIFVVMSALDSTPQAQEAAWYNGRWPQEQVGTDLKPDREILYGRLSNGLRYAVIHNERPKGRVSLYLNVQAGSLMETKDELGFAHFVEHMAFNGTRNFPPGTLIPFFQKHGMSFGGDTNAHTSRLETVYKINLANVKPESLRDGLLVLRDFADGITFEVSEVEKEKGVILAEKDARDSEVMRNRRGRTEKLYAGTAFVNLPIGTEDCIKGATSEKLRNFYKKWYHPERMVVLAVGDVSSNKIAPLIENAFASIVNPGPLPYPTSWGEVKIGGLKAEGEKREISGEEVAVLMRFPRKHVHDSRLKQLHLLIEQVISQCIRQHLMERDAQDSLWNEARFISRKFDGLQPSANFVVSTYAGGWQKALSALAQEAARIAATGFTAKEIEQALEIIEKRLKRANAQQKGKTNSDKADEFVSVLNRDAVYTSNSFDLELFAEQRKQVTIKAVNEIVSGLLRFKDVYIAVGGQNPPSSDVILQTWRDGLVNEKDAKQVTEKNFPYLPLPTMPENSATFLSRRDVVSVNGKAVSVHEARLNHSLQLHLLPLTFEPNKAWVQLIFGQGYAALTNADAVLARTATLALDQSGTGSLGRAGTQRLAEVIGGRVKEVHSPYYSSISITGDASSLEKLIQAVWTQYADPYIDENSLQRALRILEAGERTQQETVDAVSRVKGKAFFYGDEARFHSLTLKDARSCDLGSLQHYLRHSRKTGQLHLLIGGDINEGEALKLAERYFASFKPVPSQRLSPRPLIFPSGKVVNLEVDDSVDRSVVKRAWLLDWNPAEGRKVFLVRQMAAVMLRDKLRRDLREKLGVSYSPSAVYRPMVHENNFALLEIEVSTDRQHRTTVSQYLQSVQAFQVTDEELNRLRRPVLTRMRANLSNLTYWQRILPLTITTGLPFMDWSSSDQSDMQQISPSEVTEALRLLLASPSAMWSVTAREGKGE